MIAARQLFAFFIGLVLTVTYGCQEQQAQPKKSAAVPAVKPARTSLKPSESPGKAARIRHADQTFDVYTVDYPKETIQFFWKDDRGDKLKSIDSLKAYVERSGQR